MRLEYFQMIDRIVDISLDELTIRVEATIPTSSPVFEGHFPGHPLMPGVLLVETMAQTTGFLILARVSFAQMPLLAAIKDAKLRQFVTPGEILTVDGRLLHEGSGFAVAKCEIRIGAKQVCEAELTYRIMPFPDPEMRAALEAVAARAGLPMRTSSDAR